MLEEVVRLQREVAAALADQLGLSRYDALLDGYEPGARSAQIAPLFQELGAFLPGLIAAEVWIALVTTGSAWLWPWPNG